MRILVVDNSTEFLRTTRHLLREMGHDPVAVARSGDEGLAVAAGLAPDLVLVDLNTPGLDGIETARIMRSQPGAAPVIAMGDRDDAEFHTRWAEAGCDGFIAKTDLASNLPRVLGRLVAARARADVSLEWVRSEPGGERGDV
jgi:CheY-like chemotaxis protein